MTMNKEKSANVDFLIAAVKKQGVRHYLDDGMWCCEWPMEHIDKIIAIGNPAVDALIAELMSGDANLREIAAYALGNIGGDQAIVALIQALSDRISAVRAVSIKYLGLSGDKRAVDSLIRLADTDEDNLINIADALGNIGDCRAVETLIRIMKKDGFNVKVFSKIEDMAVDPLVNALKDPDVTVRKNAAKAFLYIRNSLAVEALIETLHDKNRHVRSVAISGLAVQRDTRAVGPLITILKDQNNDKDLRKSAIDALGEIGDSRAVELLIEVLKDDAFRFEAIEALGKLRDKRAVKLLIGMLKEDNQYLRRVIIISLGELRDIRAIKALRGLWSDKSYFYDEYRFPRFRQDNERLKKELKNAIALVSESNSLRLFIMDNKLCLLIIILIISFCLFTIFKFR